ncbi:MAG: arginine--tRNA ligase, partial [Akkermansiaceae bacterium]|nr:arginine--tRNA ligase [Akkermansiaceae bacterium]
MTLAQLLEERLRSAVREAGFDDEARGRVSVTQAADLRFGDYQSNAAMVLAKGAGRNPRELAEELAGATTVDGLAEMEIAGPGFLNFRVLPAAFAERAGALLGDERLGVGLVEEARTIVVDFSAPNIAKPMHVGHIRSTIIGDALARVARFLGHRVVTDNHVGDWGTQFGMVIWAWKRELDRAAIEADPLAELLRLYRVANAACKKDDAIREECREELVRLQQGEPGNLEIWEECVRLSRNGLEKIYDRLKVGFDHWLGESCYNERLAGVVDSLLESGQARESQGAVCVFSDGAAREEQDPFRIRKDGEWQDNPMIIRKSDGGFNYSTSDVATIDYRLETFGADAIWYVVDHRQTLHFRQLFALAARRGVQADLNHVAFG